MSPLARFIIDAFVHLVPIPDGIVPETPLLRVEFREHWRCWIQHLTILRQEFDADTFSTRVLDDFFRILQSTPGTRPILFYLEYTLAISRATMWTLVFNHFEGTTHPRDSLNVLIGCYRMFGVPWSRIMEILTALAETHPRTRRARTVLDWAIIHTGLLWYRFDQVHHERSHQFQQDDPTDAPTSDRISDNSGDDMSHASSDFSVP